MNYPVKDMENFVNNADKLMPDITISEIQEFFKAKYNRGNISRILAYYLHRSGFIEELHAKYHISDEDMKILNKDIVNRTAGFFEMIKDGYWKKIFVTMSWYWMQAKEWDLPEPDTINFVDEVKF